MRICSEWSRPSFSSVGYEDVSGMITDDKCTKLESDGPVVLVRIGEVLLFRSVFTSTDLDPVKTLDS